MRLVYMDEAGTSRTEPVLVVSAVIVHADRDLVAIERHLDRLVERWIPEEHRGDFIFHATELFNGGGKVFKRGDPRWPIETRLKIADDLAAIPRRYRLPLMAAWADRSKFPATPSARANFDMLNASQRTIAEHVTAFSACSLKVDHWMREKAPEEVCMLIVEDNAEARGLMRETQSYHQDRSRLEDYDPEARKHFPLRKIKEDPLFQQKRRSSALQVADFCAYVVKKIVMKDRRYDRFIDPMLDQFYQTFSVGRA